MSNKSLFVLTLLCSFMVSNFFWLGHIDQDFFSFYYIGRGVTEGQLMYKDFTDNKGPVLYLFFSLLYLIFGNNYALALIMSSTIIDGLSLFVIFKLLERDFGFKWPKNKILTFFLLSFFVLIYKSFSIGSFGGSIYSENVGMLFLVLSLWFMGKRRMFTSGVLFSLSILTRLTYAPFILLLFTILFYKHKSINNFGRFILGGISTVLFFISVFIYNNELNNFIFNVLKINSTTLTNNWERLITSVIGVSSIEFRILISIVFCLTVLIFILLKDPDREKKGIFLALFISSFVSSFLGGGGNNFYFHHFFQFNLMIIVAVAQAFMIKKFKELFIVLFVLLFMSLVINYIFYIAFHTPKIPMFKNQVYNIPELNSKKYLIVMPNAASYYIIYNKRAPDRYFFYFHLMDKHNSQYTKDLNRHKQLTTDQLKDTIFVFAPVNNTHYEFIDDYKATFGKEFGLVKINEYTINDSLVEIYEAKL